LIPAFYELNEQTKDFRFLPREKRRLKTDHGQTTALRVQHSGTVHHDPHIPPTVIDRSSKHPTSRRHKKLNRSHDRKQHKARKQCEEQNRSTGHHDRQAESNPRPARHTSQAGVPGLQVVRMDEHIQH